MVVDVTGTIGFGEVVVVVETDGISVSQMTGFSGVIGSSDIPGVTVLGTFVFSV